MATVGEIVRCPFCRKGEGRMTLAAGAYPGWEPGKPVAQRLEWADFLAGQNALRFGSTGQHSRPCPHLLILTGRVLGRPSATSDTGPRATPWWRLEYHWLAPTVEKRKVTPAGFWLATLADGRDHMAGLLPRDDYSWESVRRNWSGVGDNGQSVWFESICTILAARKPEDFLQWMNGAGRNHWSRNVAPSNRGGS